jgi:hypothetical protein
MKAFPTNKTLMLQDDNEKMYLQSFENLGMDLRDYFAAKALNVFLLKLNENYVMSDAAFDAYSVADEMMVAREK